MTFEEALVPACLQMYYKGEIELSESTGWGFTYTNVRSETVEGRARKLSNSGPKYTDYQVVFPICKKAAEICKQMENSPLWKALK